MVLDEEHRQLEVVADAADERAELGDLLVVQSARGLVEQEQARPRDEGACELDQLLRPVGKRGSREVRELAQADDVEHVERVALARLPPARVRADEHVLEHGHRPEELDVLEGPRDPLAHDPVRRLAQERLAVELDLAGVGPVEARDDVERRRLPGAVRTDQPRDLAALDVERDTVERDDAPEAERDVPHCE